MRRVYQAASLVFIAIGLYVVLEARNLTLFTEMGPGSGFFPFWIGLIFMLLSAIWLGQVSLQPDEHMEEDFIPSQAALVRILSIVVALVLFSALVGTVGFQLLMFCFLLFLLIALGRQKPLITALVSLAGSFGVYYVFTQWLDVHLPESSIEFFKNLGL